MPEFRKMFRVHGPAGHDDRTGSFFVPADRFQSQVGGTFGNTNGVPRWRAANAANMELVALIELPFNFVVGPSQATLFGWLWAQPTGVLGAASVMLGAELLARGAGDILAAYTAPGLAAVGIPAQVVAAGSSIIIQLPMVGGAAKDLAATDRAIAIKIRRDASNSGDTFEELLDFLGINLQVIVDQ